MSPFHALGFNDWQPHDKAPYGLLEKAYDDQGVVLASTLVTIDNPGCLVVCISPQVQKTIRVHMTIVGNGVKKHKQKAHAEK